MSYGELTLPPVWTGINKQTGRFLKGHVPVNKGKPWSKWMPKRSQKRCAKGWKNLDLHRYQGIRWYFESDNVWTTKIATP